MMEIIKYQLGHFPIKPGTLFFSDCGYYTHLTDDGEGNVLNFDGETVGTVNYTTGEVILRR